MTIKNVTVAGGGVLGSQIAFQTALCGFPVTLYDINDSAIQAAQTNLASLQPAYQHDKHLSVADFQDGLRRISFTTDLTTAVTHADLVIEAIPEKLTIKQNFYQQLAQVAPSQTIFASNSSTLLPSQLSGLTNRPDRYLHLHFANQIWQRNTAEIMGSPMTSPATITAVTNFAKGIKMVPILLKKEYPGYVLNAMLVPWLNSALTLWAKGIATPKTIDKTWMIDLNSPVGPFAVLDAIGLTTHYNIVSAEAARTNNSDLKMVAQKMAARIEANLLGPSTGQGFYHWPNPEFMTSDFLK